MRGKPLPGSHLKLVFHLKEPVVSEEGIDIVIVPAAFSQFKIAERRETCSWLKPLVAATTNDTRVLYFAYDLELDGTDIKKLQQETNTQQRPVLFICHSLGGLILKQALWIAHQHTPDAETPTLEDVTSGILFLGSPHTTSKDDKNWENRKWILKSTRKDVPKQSLTDEDIGHIGEVCQHFEKLDLHIRVISVFEANKSKVRDSLLKFIRSDTNRQILFDQQLCQTGSRYEETFEVDADHNSMWLVKVDSHFYNRLVKLFRSVTEEAPGDVALLCNKPVFNDSLTLHSEPINRSSENNINSRHTSPNLYDET
ncbi:uncharacterized protein BDZ99DRAFT_576851 [Mytilinidion resinicola]|uniref:DUF676 domain-containing protein n=1 Tax=Mytilinidion resinicola TaxID=574789 RepID=A0A6A6Y138_9PEZI|nr:uncharacterized protein BDZ99DRAFT_576851 [Mytilinidion resinicola]KAF2802482.1 hypothetical protein BDZ99DRAFT_576851 [Mytilinidion resinicola]